MFWLGFIVGIIMTSITIVAWALLISGAEDSHTEDADT